MGSNIDCMGMTNHELIEELKNKTRKSVRVRDCDGAIRHILSVSIGSDGHYILDISDEECE